MRQDNENLVVYRLQNNKFTDFLYRINPNFKAKSFTSVVISINITISLIMFALSLFLDMTNSCLVFKLGGCFAPSIKYHYAFYRWVMPIFLHFGFWHIFWNSVSLFFIGYEIEKYLQTPNYIKLYLLSGIAGFIFSSGYEHHALSAGASTSIFGIVAIKLLLLIRECNSDWKDKWKTLVIFILIVYPGLFDEKLMVYFSNYGHLGGFVFGIFYGTLALYSFNGAGKYKIIGASAVLAISVLLGLYRTFTIPTRDVVYC